MSTPIAALPFMGGTLSCFDPSDNTVIESTAGGSYNTTFSTCSLLISGLSTSHLAPLQQISFATSPTWSTAATLWVHWVEFQTFQGFAIFESLLLDVLNSATVVARVTVTVVDGPVGIYKLYTLQSGTLTLVGTVSIPIATLQTFDVKVVGNSASGSAALYVAGTQAIAATGLNHSGWSGTTQIKLWGGLGDDSHGGPMYWSQVIADAASTVGRFLRTDRLNTNSATNTGWTGTVSNINEIPTNDSNPLLAASANLVSTFYETGLSLGTYNILARAVGARMRIEDGSGPQNIELAIRSGSTNYVSASIAAAVGFQAAFNSWTTDPNTSAAWTDAGAAAAESGVKSIT